MIKRLDQRHLLPILAYLLVAVYLTSPVIGSFSTRFVGSETGDVYEMARHIWWYKTALQTGEDIFEHSLLGHPEGFPAIQLWANPLKFLPSWLFAFVMPLAAAYNLGVIFTLFLNGFSMYLLARRWLATEHAFPLFLAGFVYMVFPALQGTIVDGRLGLLVQYPVPLLIILLFDYADHGGKGRFLAAMVFFILTAMGHTLQIIYVTTPLVSLFILARLHHRDYVGAARAFLVALAGCLLLLLFLSPVLAESLSRAQASSDGSQVRQSIDLFGVVSPSPNNPLWRLVSDASSISPGQGVSYVGVLGGLLALLGIVSRREARWWLLVALVAWILALGPVLKLYDHALTASIAGYEAVVPLPFALLMNLPFFELARHPSRFMLLFAAMFALLVGFGATILWPSRFIQRRQPWLQAALAVVISLILVQEYKLSVEFPSVPAAIPQEIHDLKQRRDIRAIYNAPYDNLLAAKEAMYLQTAHGKPLIAGYDADVAAADPARLDLLASFRPPLLTGAAADVVIINKAYAPESGQSGLLQRARQWLGEPIYEDQRYALFETPFTLEQTPKLHSTKWDGQSHVTYIYKEQPGWMEFTANFEAVNRRVSISLNGTSLESLQVRGRIPVSIPLPMARGGYHTFRIALDPPCPERIEFELFLCQGVAVDSVDTRILSNGVIYDPIRIAGGIVLAGYYLPKQFDDEVAIRLWWSFESQRSVNDVRFVHILDENGLPVSDRPDDHSFGEISAGSELTETLKLDTSKLADGEYRILTGWYELPFAIRYDVLTNVEGAQDDTVVLGTILVRN